MCSQRKGFDFGAGFPFWGRGWGEWGPGRGRGRRQMFEAGEIKFVILRLLKEKPRHGYEVMKALEEKMAGELQAEFTRLARGTFRHAWRRGPDDPAVRRVVEILKQAADDVERAWQTSTL